MLKKVLIFAIPILAVIIGLVVGLFVIGPRLAPKTPEPEPREGVLYALPKMTVNLDDPDYVVQVQLVLEFVDQDTLDAILKKDPQMAEIKHIIIMTLGKFKPEDFVGPKRKATLAKLAEAINDAYGDRIILRIYTPDILITKLP